MSKLLDWMKEVFTKAENNDFLWKPIYDNNMPSNGKSGIYTDMFFEKDGKYQYRKFSIEYVTRCDTCGISHPEDGIRYYVLHLLEINDLKHLKSRSLQKTSIFSMMTVTPVSLMSMAGSDMYSKTRIRLRRLSAPN